MRETMVELWNPGGFWGMPHFQITLDVARCSTFKWKPIMGVWAKSPISGNGPRSWFQIFPIIHHSSIYSVYSNIFPSFSQIDSVFSCFLSPSKAPWHQVTLLVVRGLEERFANLRADVSREAIPIGVSFLIFEAIASTIWQRWSWFINVGHGSRARDKGELGRSWEFGCLTQTFFALFGCILFILTCHSCADFFFGQSHLEDSQLLRLGA